MESCGTYDREQILKNRFNKFLSENLFLPEHNYYGQLDTTGFIALKSALSDINNILTLRLSLGFADQIAHLLKLNADTTNALKAKVLETKPNANGFDLSLSFPVAFIAEVKCNIPINTGSKYGSAQRRGIEKDIDCLVRGKAKCDVDSSSCLKFFAFLDLPEIRAANDHLLRVSETCRKNLVFPVSPNTMDRFDIVYGIYVKMR